MKSAPVYRALSEKAGVRQLTVHTGHHYDFNMSDVFFQQLGMPQPNVNLQVGSGSHAKQTAEVMARFEDVVLEYRPEWVLVYGDVNSTVAAALVCAKLGTKIAHVEAGLRSFDRTMPEEINRLMTDVLADLLFTPSEDGNRNLEHEGIPKHKIRLVGNVMIDTLVRMLPEAQNHLPTGMPPKFALVTLHRPSNVDDLQWLSSMLKTLEHLSSELAVVFPAHPRTRQRMREAGITLESTSLYVLEPQPYLGFLALQQRATVVITDSGGIQEETTYLGTPCLTVRNNTERPITTELGSNVLVGRDVVRIGNEVKVILEGKQKRGSHPKLWDGHAAQRIAEILVNHPDSMVS
jgi:UDP-N-acetylglucosamine 2-epimerase (non-hydrolysing)